MYRCSEPHCPNDANWLYLPVIETVPVNGSRGWAALRDPQPVCLAHMPRAGLVGPRPQRPGT